MVLDGARLVLTARGLSADTTYTIQVDDSLTDVFGQRLGAAGEGHFTTGAASPRVDIETGSWAVETDERREDRVAIVLASFNAATALGHRAVDGC